MSRETALANLSDCIQKAYAAGATTEQLAERLAWGIVQQVVREKPQRKIGAKP